MIRARARARRPLSTPALLLPPLLQVALQSHCRCSLGVELALIRHEAAETMLERLEVVAGRYEQFRKPLERIRFILVRVLPVLLFVCALG